MDEHSKEILRRQVLNFLSDFKELMGQGKYIVSNHHKNLQALINLGITNRIRDDLIRSISLGDYCSGPNPDQLHPGHYWIFGKNIEKAEIYIKLKIVAYTNNEVAICISFHPAEYSLSYPFSPAKITKTRI